MSPRDIALSFFIAAIWGFNFIAAKMAVDVFSPMVANSLRFGVAGLIFLPFLRIVKGQMTLILWVAFLLGVMHFGLVNLSVKMAGGVGAISIAGQLGVPFSTILAILVLGESVGWKRILGISLSFGGVIFLTFDPVIFDYWLALVVGAASAFVYAVCSILMRKMQDVSPFTTHAWVGVVAFTGSIVISTALGDNFMAEVNMATTDHWLAILYMGIGSSVIAHGSANYLFKKYEVSVVSPYFLVMPLFAILGGVVILNEDVSWRVFVGGALTIIGVLIVTIRNTKKHSVAAELPRTEG